MSNVIHIHIHFRASDGEIFGHENSLSPDKRPGLEIASFKVPDGRHIIPDPLLHKIDPVTLDLVDKTETERELALRPPLVTLDDIKAAIGAALRASDAYMMPDRPLSDDVREAWVEYRQMLRDLSKLGTASEMINAWKIDPSGNDQIAALRARQGEASN